MRSTCCPLAPHLCFLWVVPNVAGHPSPLKRQSGLSCSKPVARQQPKLSLAKPRLPCCMVPWPVPTNCLLIEHNMLLPASLQTCELLQPNYDAAQGVAMYSNQAACCFCLQDVGQKQVASVLGIQAARANTAPRPFLKLMPQHIAVQVPECFSHCCHAGLCCCCLESPCNLRPCLHLVSLVSMRIIRPTCENMH